jgi:hypothetical protein
VNKGRKGRGMREKKEEERRIKRGLGKNQKRNQGKN